MRSIKLTYPGFQALPQNLRKLLLESETFFFAEAQPQFRAWEVCQRTPPLRSSFLPRAKPMPTAGRGWGANAY